MQKVLNWDSTGHPEKNIPNIVRDRRRFKLLDQRKAEMIRIALHPRDPQHALLEQKEIIRVEHKDLIKSIYTII